MGWGNLVTYEQQLKMLDERDSYSHFYYRGLNAENGVDLYVRLSSFLDTLHRDFENSKFEDNCIIVSHGLTIRMFISRWLHLSVEDYEEIKNPKNCEYFILELNPETNKYQLSKPLEKHNIYHDWRYVKDNDEYSDSLIQEHEILQKELSSNMILEEKIPTTQSTFYDIKHLSIDKKIKLLEHAIDIRTKAWIDKLDCSISIARQQVTDMTFPDIVNKLENRSHFVVIKRYDFCKNQYYGEIGFSTNPDIDGVTYFLFIYVLMNNLNDIVNKYDLVNHI